MKLKTGRERPSHVLIVRFSAMGDVAMSLRAIWTLRKTYPDVRITVATKQKFARFYDDIPNVTLLCLPSKSSFKDLAGIVKKAKSMGVDAVADIHNTLRGKFIRLCFMLSGVRVAHLDKMRDARKALKNHKGGNVVPIRHNVLRFCDVFAELGLPVPVPTVERVINPIPGIFGKKTGSWAGYAPFASKSMKIYPEDLSRQFVDKLTRVFDRVFIFCGPGKEKEFADSLQQAYPNVTTVFGKTDIWGEMDLMSNLNVIVTMDSSAMHMASIVGTPLVSVWGATHPAAGFHAYGTDMERNCVQLNLDCRPCSIYGEGDCFTRDFKCMRGIPPDMIMEKVMLVAEK